MNNLETLKRDEFDKIVGAYCLPPYFDYDACFSIYSLASKFVKEVVEEKGPFIANGINQLDILNYTVGEVVYTLTGGHKIDKNNEKLINGFANIIVDKYLSLFW